MENDTKLIRYRKDGMVERKRPLCLNGKYPLSSRIAEDNYKRVGVSVLADTFYFQFFNSNLLGGLHFDEAMLVLRISAQDLG